MRDFLRNLFVRNGSPSHRRDVAAYRRYVIEEVNAQRRKLRRMTESALQVYALEARELLETVAVAAVAAERLLGL